jgi:hypothetical protein
VPGLLQLWRRQQGNLQTGCAGVTGHCGCEGGAQPLPAQMVKSAVTSRALTLTGAQWSREKGATKALESSRRVLPKLRSGLPGEVAHACSRGSGSLPVLGSVWLPEDPSD